MSHPTRMRGLKLQLYHFEQFLQEVASYTDAWIETASQSHLPIDQTVASYTDAWIETIYLKNP